MDKLNCAMRDSAVEAGCHSKQHVKPKRYWCPELSKLRDRKRFWWQLWVENGRPREGSVFSVYNDVKKAFRHRSRYQVADQTRNEHYQLYEMIKARYMTGFWNVIKRRRSIQVKSSLTASDFNSFNGDVMQALPDSSHDQTYDKKIVDTYYCITPIFRVEEIFAIFANLDFARNFPPAKIISTVNGISRNFPPAKFSSPQKYNSKPL